MEQKAEKQVKQRIYVIDFKNAEADPRMEELRDSHYYDPGFFGSEYGWYDCLRNVLKSSPHIIPGERKAGGTVLEAGSDFFFETDTGASCRLSYDMDHYLGMEDIIFFLDEGARDEDALLTCLNTVFSEYLGYPLTYTIRESDAYSWRYKVVFFRKKEDTPLLQTQANEAAAPEVPLTQPVLEDAAALTQHPHKPDSNLKWLCATAIGTALFVVLSLCLQVPVFENYYLCLGYVAMAVCLYSFGTVSGTLVGVLGVVLYCMLISGLRGLPGWAAGNLVIGIIVGLTFRVTKRLQKPWLQAGLNLLAVIVSTALGILILKSVTECLLYAQPMLVRIGKNIFAFVADIVVLVCSVPICMLLDQPIKKALHLAE